MRTLGAESDWTHWRCTVFETQTVEQKLDGSLNSRGSGRAAPVNATLRPQALRVSSHIPGNIAQGQNREYQYAIVQKRPTESATSELHLGSFLRFLSETCLRFPAFDPVLRWNVESRLRGHWQPQIATSKAACGHMIIEPLVDL
eukprot:979271-Amphidinium_carterae.2